MYYCGLFGVFWSTVSVNFLLKMIDSIPKKNSAFCLKTSYFMNK